MNNLSLAMVVLLFLQHFIFDWFFQSREMATKKSSDIKWLIRHCDYVFSGFFLYLLLIFNFKYALLGALFYVIIHGLQDWNIRRIYKRFNSSENYWEEKLFFDFIALDQLLHFAEMIIIIYFLGTLK